MSFLFWALATIMLMAAVGFVAVPLKAARPSPGTPATLAIIAVPLAVSGLYFLLGSPGVKSAESSPSRDDSDYSRVSSSTARSSNSIGTVASLVDGLNARLQVEPDDAGGWLLLAQSYDHLGRYADALDAYRRAQALGKTDIDFETSLFGSLLSIEPSGTNVMFAKQFEAGEDNE